MAERKQDLEPNQGLDIMTTVVTQNRQVPEQAEISQKLNAENTKSWIEGNNKLIVNTEPLVPTANSFDKQVKSYLNQAGMNLTEFADLLNATISGLRYWLKGDRTPTGTGYTGKLNDVRVKQIIRKLCELEIVTSLDEVNNLLHLAFPTASELPEFTRTEQKQPWYKKLVASSYEAGNENSAGNDSNDTNPTSKSKAGTGLLVETNAFAEKVKYYCHSIDFTIKDLAERLEVHYTTVRYWINGDSRNPKSKLNPTSVKLVIAQLARLDALSGVSEAIELLELAFPGRRRLHKFNATDTRQDWYLKLVNLAKGGRTGKDAAAPYLYHRNLLLGTKRNPQIYATYLPQPPATPTATFIGRDSEVTNLLETLAEPATRLVTITGPGGIGKTRLVREVANHFKDTGQYRDGVCFVSLAEVTGEVDLAAYLCRVFGLVKPQVKPGKNAVTEKVDYRELLTSYLELKRRLVVLDNLEQIISLEVTEFLAELIEETRYIQLLVTSREVLKLDSEHVLRLSPLGLPPENLDLGSNSEESMSLIELGNYPAIALFVGKARKTSLGFKLTASNITSVVSLCRKLSGVPLALELTARSMGYFGLEKILSLLNASQSGFSLVTSPVGSSKQLPPRHKSLEAVMDWSFNLLTLQEKFLFSQLALFRDGFSLEAVVEILGAGMDNFETGELVGLLCRLVDKSLVEVDTGFITYEDGTSCTHTRYSLLELARGYAHVRFLEMAGNHGAVA